MHLIPTSPEAVSKLKKAAKLLARGDAHLKHADALDRVAKDAGYLHWKHVTTCAEAQEASVSSWAKLTAAQCSDPRFGKPKDQELIVFSGPSGSGKSFRAIDCALNWMRQGKPVHVLDVGRSYWHLCRMIGGTYSSFTHDGSRVDEHHGNTPFVVFELEALVGHQSAIETIVPFHEIAQGAFLIVDETWQIHRLFGTSDALNRLVSNHLESGGSAALLMTDGIKVDAGGPSLAIESSLTVRRSLVSLGRI